MELSVNGYHYKAAYAIMRNTSASMASFNGIREAALGEPGAGAGLLNMSKELIAARKNGPPSYAEGVEARRDSAGHLWQHLREELNKPGAIDTNTKKIQEAQQLAESSRPRNIELQKQEITASDAHSKQARKKLLAEYSRARNASGKNQILQKVRNAYANLEGANLPAVRAAFINLIG